MTQTSVRNRLLAILAVIAVVGALKVTQPVTLPLATAIFLLVLFWPLQAWLQARVPRPLAYAVTILAMLLVIAGFMAAVGWSLAVVVERAPEVVERARQLQAELGGWAEERELPIGGGATGDEGPGDDGAGAGAIGEALLPALAALWAAGAGLFLTLAFFVLALGEVRAFRRRLVAHFGARGERALVAVREIGGKSRGFFLALTLAGLLAGGLSLAYGFALGLEHVLVWAFLAYLLNYIPVVGPTLAVFPPALWALVQFDGVARPLAVLVGFGAIQFVVGNYIAPRFEGRYTRVSPLIVLVSILLWWWVWGPVGAVLGVPITVAALVACGHAPATRWIPALLAEEEADEGGR
jgi:AI-2 transport protein TqsA